MNYINKLIVRVRESKKGQTMTEYVLILAAIAVAGYTAYVGLEGGDQHAHRQRESESGSA